jgi:hypothetical protein
MPATAAIKRAKIDIADVKRAAQERALDVLAWLDVHDRPSAAGYISMCNPVMKDRHPSFTIWTKGAAVGAWRDERDPKGTCGDIIDLVSYLSGWWDLPNKGRAQARRWLSDRLRLERVDPARLAADRAAAQRRQAQAEKVHDETLANNQARAFQLWIDAEPALAGTPVDRYLRARGIVLEALPRGPRGGERMPHIIRYLPAHPHSESGKKFDCMVAGCVDGSGKILAVHRTWLAEGGAAKADVSPVKKVWPSFAGLVIPLWRGDSGLSVRDAAACGLRETLVLTEGIEDGLSAVTAAPQYRTWAFISLGNLANVVLPECCDGVMLHRQNEWENRIATLSFDRGKRALEAQGRPVIEIKAFAGKDLNDTLRGEG